MRPLLQIVRDPQRRTAIVADVVHLIDREVAGKGGVSGLAIRSGYKVVSRLKGGRMIPAAANLLLDEFAVAIDPLRMEWAAQGGGSFVAFLQAREQQASEALLAITDRRAERSDNRVLVATYRKLRPMAQRHVGEALPGVGRLIEKYHEA